VREKQYPLGDGSDAHILRAGRMGTSGYCNRLWRSRVNRIRFFLRGRAREAERAIENACLNRFGTLRPKGETPVVRSDNGLVFQSRRFRAACCQYNLTQEFITPYTPEQNGIIERFFRSLKEECIWQHNFISFGEAKRIIGEWIDWYNSGRPHQALGNMSPIEYLAKQSPLFSQENRC